jgi:hypothetical protein
MPLKDPEARKEYVKQWYQKNQEYKSEYDKEYSRQWYQKNKKHKDEKSKQYSKTDAGKKSNRISQWKYNGVKCDDFDALYEYYINTTHCENCDVELVEGNKAANRKCLDHSHETGEFRNVPCNTCNKLRGK